MGKHRNSDEYQNNEDIKNENIIKEVLIVNDNKQTDNDESLSDDSSSKTNNVKKSDGLIVSETIPECSCNVIKPKGKSGPLVAKIPVVISELEIEISCGATISLDQPALEIKRVGKNVYLTQCKLLPNSKRLFIKGFVRKNIEYAAAKSKESRGGSNIRHMNFNIPFNCVTMVDYYIEPVLSIAKDEVQVKTQSTDSYMWDNANGNNESLEYFNEQIYCQLKRAQVTELDIMDEGNGDSSLEKPFQKLEEKMVVKIILELLQNQEVNISFKSPSSKKP